MIDEKYMVAALAMARKAERLGEVPVGAVLVQKEEIVASAFNQSICLHDPSAHAEVLVLRQAGAQLGNYRLTGTTLYVTLEPCMMCVGAMVQARVDRLVFGAFDPKSGAVHSVFLLDHASFLNHHIQWSGGVMQDVCGDLLRLFFQKKR